MSHCVPEAPATTSEDGDISEQESEADWSVTYSSGVKRALDVRMVYLDLGVEAGDLCMKFDKDGKHLAVGFWGGATNIYDVQTGEKTWLVCVFVSDQC